MQEEIRRFKRLNSKNFSRRLTWTKFKLRPTDSLLSKIRIDLRRSIARHLGELEVLLRKLSLGMEEIPRNFPESASECEARVVFQWRSCNQP
ncbi:hypothetical protein VNO77_15194 [Canavalia gladiata]|uniref:Uncharacterized protein n=1 Tax=Canavalia gladiata TaxID=3824 RepID=A0AAN9M432_CANGL